MPCRAPCAVRSAPTEPGAAAASRRGATLLQPLRRLPSLLGFAVEAWNLDWSDRFLPPSLPAPLPRTPRVCWEASVSHRGGPAHPALAGVSSPPDIRHCAPSASTAAGWAASPDAVPADQSLGARVALVLAFLSLLSDPGGRGHLPTLKVAGAPSWWWENYFSFMPS